MRRIRELLYAVLLLVGAGYGFGNSGVGLALLWLEVRRERRDGRACTLARERRWREIIETEQLTFAHVSPWRVLLVGERSGRVEVFRDEVTDPDWARLRRACLGIGCDDP
ncbi:MAG: hypothetical protein PVH91_05010 [Pseudomonadales bacterium]